jgi:hypothetical protein
MSVNVQDASVDRVQIAEVFVCYHHARSIRYLLHYLDERVEVWGLLLIDRLDQSAGFCILKPEGPRSFADVHSAYRNGIEPGLLVGEIME